MHADTKNHYEWVSFFLTVLQWRPCTDNSTKLQLLQHKQSIKRMQYEGVIYFLLWLGNIQLWIFFLGLFNFDWFSFLLSVPPIPCGTFTVMEAYTWIIQKPSTETSLCTSSSLLWQRTLKLVLQLNHQKKKQREGRGKCTIGVCATCL